MPFKNIQKTSKKTKKCLYSNGKMIINIDQPWDLDGFWGSYFQTNQFFKVKAHKPKAPQPCFSLAQSSIFLQYHFWAACWQRDSHPKETHGENWPKACKTKSFFRVKHVKGPTFEYHDFWWFLIGCTHVGANPACLEIHPLGEWPGLRELSWCDTFSGWWLSPTPLKNDGVRQLGLLNFTRSWDFVIFRGYWISR